MGYLSHSYAWRLASASFAGATIERLQYRDTLDVVIRFADWRGRRFQPKALEISENELLVLLGDAIAAGIFSVSFVSELQGITSAPRSHGDHMTSSSFILIMSPAGLEPSASAYTADAAQSFDKLTDAIFAGQAQADVRFQPWISFENLVFTPDHVRVIYKKILAEAGKELRNADWT